MQEPMSRERFRQEVYLVLLGNPTSCEVSAEEITDMLFDSAKPVEEPPAEVRSQEPVLWGLGARARQRRRAGPAVSANQGQCDVRQVHGCLPCRAP
jgi:hypothetical protein